MATTTGAHLLLTLSSSPAVPGKSSTVASHRLSCFLPLLTFLPEQMLLSSLKLYHITQSTVITKLNRLLVCKFPWLKLLLWKKDISLRLNTNLFSITQLLTPKDLSSPLVMHVSRTAENDGLLFLNHGYNILFNRKNVFQYLLFYKKKRSS